MLRANPQRLEAKKAALRKKQKRPIAVLSRRFIARGMKDTSDIVITRQSVHFGPKKNHRDKILLDFYSYKKRKRKHPPLTDAVRSRKRRHSQQNKVLREYLTVPERKKLDKAAKTPFHIPTPREKPESWKKNKKPLLLSPRPIK